MLPSSEECAVGGFQLVAVRVAHGADADHTGQLAGEGVASEGGRRGHGPNNLYALHANKLQVGVLEVCDQLWKYIGGRGERRDYEYKGRQMSQVGVNLSTIKYNI